MAFRRFLPALQKVEGIEYVGVAVATPEEWTAGAEVTDAVRTAISKEYEKAAQFQTQFGGKIFDGYENMINSDEIDAVYLPLPPALHKKWARKVLEAGKHAYVEKPFTTSIDDTEELLKIAKENNLAVHENYMFVFHRQLEEISRIIDSGELGEIRQYRISFGFPLRPAGDFRYNKALGGGAILDAGGYCMRLAAELLGPTAELKYAFAKSIPGYEVDMFGSGVMINSDGISAQFSFGMDCDYKCELEIWGSKGTLTTGRILTAPEGLEPEMTIKHNQEYETRKLSADTPFGNSIRHFMKCVGNKEERNNNQERIRRQSAFLSDFISKTK